MPMPVRSVVPWMFAAVAALTSVTELRAETTIKFVPHADLKIVDPIWTTGYITRNHGYMVYDTLFAMDSSFKPQPQMVDTFTVSEDKKTYTFALRAGLKFHDGSPVRPADVVASLKRWGKRDVAGQKLMEFTDDIVAVDDTTFAIKLKTPYGFVIDSLAKVSSNVPFIMREKEALTDPFQQVTDVIGSGPFRFVKEEWAPGNKVVYAKFADYVPRKEAPSWGSGGKVVKVDRVEWLTIPDASTAASALISGEIDWFEAPLGDLVPLFEANKQIKVEILDKLGSQGVLRPNQLLPPFDNPKARQALLYATDQSEYMAAVMGDQKYWQTCPSFFPCGTPNAATGLPQTVFVKKDLVKARALWKEVGYSGPPVVVLDPTDSPYAHQQALITAENLKAIGAPVELKAMDWSTMLAARSKKEPTAQGGWNIFHTWSVVPDQITPLTNNAMTASGAKAWFGWADDPTLEELKQRWTRAIDDAEKKKLTEEMQTRALETVPFIPTGQFVTPTAYRATLRGLITSPIPFLWNVEKGS